MIFPQLIRKQLLEFDSWVGNCPSHIFNVYHRNSFIPDEKNQGLEKKIWLRGTYQKYLEPSPASNQSYLSVNNFFFFYNSFRSLAVKEINIPLEDLIEES